MKFLNFSGLLIGLILFTNCSKKVSKEELQLLNGYWEIASVTIDSETKELPASLKADYFYLDNELKGFRKKLTPRFDGKFQKNNDQESLSVIFVKEKPFIVYETKYNTWKEEIISISENQLQLLNNEGKLYTYKPFKLKE